ncbi:MAG: toll/interleukin-1 receptor domain-containing protein [Acidobacteriia bacterium]|nr:toll/interleukin-1 receptor domain-containing protein [Terriglobia bacterium]
MLGCIPVEHNVFISYPAPNQDLVENFADHLLRNGVKAWVYSIDKTLSAETWPEIEACIDQAELFAFVASEDSRDAEGQHRELRLAVEKIGQHGRAKFRLLPIVLGGLSFSEIPSELQHVNGVRLDAHTVTSKAKEVARTFFPDLFDDERERAWHCPRPGQWLEVRRVDSGIEGFLERNDLLYFRRLSPLGLLECYSPKLHELFWIMPDNVRASGTPRDECPSVPREYRYETSINDEILGRRLGSTRQPIGRYVIVE